MGIGRCTYRALAPLDGWVCLEMLEEALGRGRPEVFNTDQPDNAFVGRLWRTVKYEAIRPGDRLA